MPVPRDALASTATWRPRTLAAGAVAVLAAAEPAAKVALSREVAEAWRGGDLMIGNADPPPRPARPPRPLLRSPRDMPKRRNFGSPAGRIALLHALAHIELNAIDLAWDLIARFGVRGSATGWPRAFFDDWVAVAAEEAEHFSLLSDRLAALGSVYGDLPAHDGLWEAAAATAHDLLARLAVVPLVLEARGLDVTPGDDRRGSNAPAIATAPPCSTASIATRSAMSRPEGAGSSVCASGADANRGRRFTRWCAAISPGR